MEPAVRRRPAARQTVTPRTPRQPGGPRRPSSADGSLRRTGIVPGKLRCAQAAATMWVQAGGTAPAARKQRPAVVKQHDPVAKQAPPLLGMASHGSCCDPPPVHRGTGADAGTPHPPVAGRPPTAARADPSHRSYTADALGRQRGRSQQRPDVAQRVPQVPVGLPAGRRAAGIGGIQAEDHPHHGGLPRPVGPEKTGHLLRQPVNDIPSSATAGANLLIWPLTSIVASMPGRLGTGGGGVVTPGSRLRRRWEGGLQRHSSL